MDDQNWQIDELKTLTALVAAYSRRLAELNAHDKSRYVTRNEFAHICSSIIHCMDRIVDQTDAMTNCMGRMADHMSRLTDEIIALRQRMEQDGGE